MSPRIAFLRHGHTSWNRVHRIQGRTDIPLDAECECLACTRYCRAYLRHLFVAREMLGPILVSLHNLAFYQKLVRGLQAAVEAGTTAEFRRQQFANWGVADSV